MTSYNYSKFINIAQKQIDRFGGDVLLHVPIDGGVDDGTGLITYNELTTTVKGIVIGYSTQEINDNEILEGDKQVLIGSDEGKPLVNNTITINEEVFRILNITEINPGVNQPVLYNLHVRSFALAVDQDTFITTLKSLTVGDIVIDPNAPFDHPKWMVLAQGHHETGITTLIESTIFHNRIWSTTIPYANLWVDSSLFTWLTTNFLAQLTIPMYNILQEVSIESQGTNYGAKISLLSVEELTGTPTSAGSSGSFIDYFVNDRYRVCLDYDDSLPAEYWTRDYGLAAGKAYNVEEDGTVTSSYTIQSTLGVRPMIFLQEGVSVALNDDGEYEIQY